MPYYVDKLKYSALCPSMLVSENVVLFALLCWSLKCHAACLTMLVSEDIVPYYVVKLKTPQCIFYIFGSVQNNVLLA